MSTNCTYHIFELSHTLFPQITSSGTMFFNIVFVFVFNFFLIF